MRVLKVILFVIVMAALLVVTWLSLPGMDDWPERMIHERSP